MRNEKDPIPAKDDAVIVENSGEQATKTRELQESGETVVEREKNLEKGFAERLQALAELAKVAAFKSGEQSGVDRLLNFGGDVLIQKYGVENLVNAFKISSEARKSLEIGGQLGAIINALEPFTEGRKALYEELRASGDALIQKGQEEYTTLTGEAHPSLPKSHLGRSRQYAFDKLQRLDSMKDDLSFLPTEWQDRAIRIFTSEASDVSVTTGLATEFQKRYGGDWDAMKNRLEEANGDLFSLYDKLDDEVRSLREELGAKKEALMEDIRQEIGRKEGEARQAFEQKLIAHLTDLDLIRERAMKTESAQQLMESAIKAMEKQVTEMKAKVDSDVEKNTTELRALLNNTEQLKA